MQKKDTIFFCIRAKLNNEMELTFTLYMFNIFISSMNNPKMIFNGRALFSMHIMNQRLKKKF